MRGPLGENVVCNNIYSCIKINIDIALFAVAEMATSVYSVTVQEGMVKTFEKRRKWVKTKETTTSEILEKFPFWVLNTGDSYVGFSVVS